MFTCVFLAAYTVIAASGFAPIAVIQVHRPSQSFASTALASTPETSTATVMTRVSDELLDMFNHQITNEFSASHLYLAASIWFDQRDYKGMSKYMRSEADEERDHAYDFIEFATRSDFPVELEYIEAPEQSGWSTVEQVWEGLLEAERENTQALFDLADQAAQSKNHAVTEFLLSYHKHQVKAEDKLKYILAKVRDEAQTPGMLRQLDGAFERKEIE